MFKVKVWKVISLHVQGKTQCIVILLIGKNSVCCYVCCYFITL